MPEIISKFVDVLPIIRESSQVVKYGFVLWAAVTASFAVLLLHDYVSKPESAKSFSVDLSNNQYIDERTLLLKGKGLPNNAEIKVEVFALNADGERNVIPQSSSLVRAPNGDWRVQWIKFQQGGKHDIAIVVIQNGSPVNILDPIRVAVADWAPSPSAGKKGATTDHVAVPKQSPNLAFSAPIRIRDSGPEGSVVGLAVATAVEAAFARAGDPLPYLSARYIYERSKNLDGMGTLHEGAKLHQGIAVAERLGVLPESDWPYVPGKHDLPLGMTWNKLDNIAINKGLRAKFVKLKDFNEAISRSMEGLPVICAIMVHSSFFEYKNGTIDSTDGQLIGHHAIVITGYDAKRQTFRFANSWGTGWGEGGFGNISSEVAKTLIIDNQIWSVEAPK